MVSPLLKHVLWYFLLTVHKPESVLLESTYWLHPIARAFHQSEIWGVISIKGIGTLNHYVHRKSPSKNPSKRASCWEVGRQMSGAFCILGGEWWPGCSGRGITTQCRQRWDYWNVWAAPMIIQEDEKIGPHLVLGSHSHEGTVLCLRIQGQLRFNDHQGATLSSDMPVRKY